MNIENAKKLVGQLERLPDEKFDMSRYVQHNECGTTACIAGWAALLNGGPEYRGSRDSDNVFYWAQDWLGLKYPTAQDLFLNHDGWPRAEAIAELNRMIAAAEATP